MPSFYIRAHRLELSKSFPLAGFTVHTGATPSWFEVALATDPVLFRAKDGRTSGNFYSTRVMGPLPADRGEAVYLVPPQVLSRFAGQRRLYYTVAMFSSPDRREPKILNTPPEAIPWISISKSFTGRALRSMIGVPNPRGGLIGDGNGYGVKNGHALEWAGDSVRPGAEPITGAPATPAAPAAPPTSAPPAVSTTTPPGAAQPGTAQAFDYDDGFGPMPLDAAQRAGNGEDGGIDGPIPDEQQPAAQAMIYSQGLSAPEYSLATRYVQAKWYRTPASPRTISRIVIHITDGGARIDGTIGWFKNPVNKDGTPRKVSAHYIVGQDGEVVQMVRHSDIAWHASQANGDSIGIEHNANTRGLNPTEAQYCSSAALVRWLCEQYSIPMDRTHILGHSEADPTTTHSACPNAVWDWDYFMGMVTSASCYPRPTASSAALSNEIPLDPGVGGRSIDARALEVGDIILSTTDEFVSEQIRRITDSPVSHSMLYVGDGLVVEAIAGGVKLRPLGDAIASATVAVAFRHPTLTAEQAALVKDFAGQQLDKPYYYWGIVRQAGFRLDRRSFCSGKTGEEYNRCVNWVGRVNLGTGRSDEFFCSQLVLAAFEHVGVPLTSTPPHWSSPGDIADLRLTHALGYVGHLKAPPLSAGQAVGAGHRIAAVAAGAYTQPLAIVRPDYTPSGVIDALKFMWEWMKRTGRWRAGVPDTTFFPHSAICQLRMSFDDGKDYIGTGFYIARDRILTCAHNVVDKRTGSQATSIRVTPGKNGETNEPFGSFTMGNRSDWEYHPRYTGGFDFDLAVIKVNTPPPNGLYFEILEELLQSRDSPIIVCGYAAETGDEHKQHLDGDMIRTLGDDNETFQYNLHTEPGTSGSPVYYLWAFEDEERKQSVLEIRIVGVHVSGHSETLNQGCRLTADKIQWIRSVGNPLTLRTQALRDVESPASTKTLRVRGTGGGDIVATLGTSSPLQVVEIASAIVGATMTRILDNQGDISWELDQLQGLKHPGNDPANAGTASYSTQTLTISGPHASTFFGADKIYVDSELTFQYNGRSVGNIQIATLRANDAAGLGLTVKSNVMDDANTYTRPPATDRFAAVKVRFHYRFTSPIYSDLIAITDLVLYGDGTYSQRFRWTQK